MTTTSENAPVSVDVGKKLIEDYYKNSYPVWKLCIESSYLIFAAFLWLTLIRETISLHNGPLPTLLGFILAQFLVDFISGVLHWGCDTWGHFTTPVFGQTLIVSFRMHHVDPQDITNHNFMETNGASAYPIPLFVGWALYTSSGSFGSQTFNWMVIFACTLGLLTNECHKWAHMVHSKPHAVIRFLQASGLIISHEKHHVHHQGQFDSAYCIINGWMNPILDHIDFWRKAEKTITWITGAIPREDDAFYRDIKVK